MPECVGGCVGGYFLMCWWIFDGRNMVLVDSSRSLVNNGFVQILLEVSRYYVYLIFFSKSLKDDCI